MGAEKQSSLKPALQPVLYPRTYHHPSPPCVSSSKDRPLEMPSLRLSPSTGGNHPHPTTRVPSMGRGTGLSVCPRSCLMGMGHPAPGGHSDTQTYQDGPQLGSRGPGGGERPGQLRRPSWCCRDQADGKQGWSWGGCRALLCRMLGLCCCCRLLSSGDWAGTRFQGKKMSASYQGNYVRIPNFC